MVVGRHVMLMCSLATPPPCCQAQYIRPQFSHLLLNIFHSPVFPPFRCFNFKMLADSRRGSQWTESLKKLRVGPAVRKIRHFYARKQLLLSVRLSHRNSVCPSITRVNQSKTVQARIIKSSPSGAWKTLVSRTVKLFHKFEGGHPDEGAKWEEVGKICDFWPISRCISVTVRDRA